MELVVLNGASNISKSVIRNLTASGNYSKVRMLDFRPYRSSVYAFQRELASNGITMDKRQTTNASDLAVAMEGAEHCVYFPHDYVSMTSDKNNFLIAASKLAKKQGIKNFTACNPIEHDLAYTEDESKCYVELRREAELAALDANPTMSLLTTDIVFGSDPSYMYSYMEQSVANGSIVDGFHQSCKFAPINQTDIARAVSHCLTNGLPGRFMLQGDKDGNKHYSAKEMLAMVERSANKNSMAPGSAAMHSITSLIDDFFTGNTHDGNLSAMLNHYGTHGRGNKDGQLTCFWKETGLKAESESVAEFYKMNPVNLEAPKDNWKFHLD